MCFPNTTLFQLNYTNRKFYYLFSGCENSADEKRTDVRGTAIMPDAGVQACDALGIARTGAGWTPGRGLRENGNAQVREELLTSLSEHSLSDRCAGGEDRSRTCLGGFAGRRMTALLPRRRTAYVFCAVFHVCCIKRGHR
jgi:hypothetical protein